MGSFSQMAVPIDLEISKVVGFDDGATEEVSVVSGCQVELIPEPPLVKAIATKSEKKGQEK